MSFSNSELQQLREVIRTNIDKLEINRIEIKADIANFVKQKQPFKAAGTKSVVDKINDGIREDYRHLDQVEKKLRKLVGLQKAIKRETQRNAHEARVSKQIYTFIEAPPAANQELQRAMDYFRHAHFDSASLTGLQNNSVTISTTGDLTINAPQVATTGFAQVEGAQTQNVQSVLTTTTDNPSAGWSDYKLENLPPLGSGIASGSIAFDLPQPQFRTLELRPDDAYIDPRWYISSQPNRIINPDFEVQQRQVDPTSKPSNPKDLIGSGKLPLHLWPTTATAMGCIGLLNGMLKYGRSNFRAIGIRASIYYDALRRHIDAWFEGEEVDADDGVPHLAAALACLAIIVDAQAAGKFTDDRAYASQYRKLVDSLTPHVARLKALHADKNPRHYTIADSAV
jgi:hypothetical protein